MQVTVQTGEDEQKGEQLSTSGESANLRSLIRN